MDEKIKLKFLKLSILTIPMFLLLLFTTITSAVIIFIRMILPVEFTYGVIFSVISGGMYLASMVIATYIAIRVWQKYIPDEEKSKF